MTEAPDFDQAVAELKTIHRRATSGDPEVAPITRILHAREHVIPRYQQVFAIESLHDLSEHDFREFLHFKNNQHWVSLQRLGPAISSDMGRLRKALEILLDEGRPIRERLSELVPGSAPCFVPRLGKAVLTPILLVCHPDRYGVWNSVSEASMKAFGFWPKLDRKAPFGDRYEKVNETLLKVAGAVGVDLWTLDALWWRAEEFAGAASEQEEPSEAGEDAEAAAGGAQFGLERHLQEFLRDNWNHTELGHDWKLYEEDGDPEAGFEYPCEKMGRIDLLAQHKSEPRWLVIELKRNQTSDKTVGQLMRYMGWVKERMAGPKDVVEGLIIARASDDAIRFSLAAVPNVRVRLYEVNFKLRGPK